MYWYQILGPLYRLGQGVHIAPYRRVAVQKKIIAAPSVSWMIAMVRCRDRIIRSGEVVPHPSHRQGLASQVHESARVDHVTAVGSGGKGLSCDRVCHGRWPVWVWRPPYPNFV